ncbi:MAG: hypothetical protein QM773_17995 [Hyphomonadaceae bacterium]
MRFSFLFLTAAISAAPAMAQVCEESVSGDIGEVIASVDARGATAISWAVERREGVGQESDNFARPGLLIDFTMSTDRVLGPPLQVEVLISRFSESERKPPPPLSSVSVRVNAGGAPITWPGDNSRDGSAKLIARLKEAWPNEVVADLVDKSGKVLASATFDLSKRPLVEKMAREARAKCPA